MIRGSSEQRSCKKKNAASIKRNAKVNNLQKKIPGESTLIQTNQYNTIKESLEKKMEIVRLGYLKLVI